MTATTLKKELVKAIDSINDAGFLQAVYTIVNQKKHKEEYDLSPGQWTEIEGRRRNYKNGESKTYTWKETKK
jgi:hypothetical protein